MVNKPDPTSPQSSRLARGGRQSGWQPGQLPAPGRAGYIVSILIANVFNKVFIFSISGLATGGQGHQPGPRHCHHPVADLNITLSEGQFLITSSTAGLGAAAGGTAGGRGQLARPGRNFQPKACSELACLGVTVAVFRCGGWKSGWQPRAFRWAWTSRPFSS